MQDEMIYVNGVNGETGDYFREPLHLRTIQRICCGHQFAPDGLRRPIEGIDEADLASAGWAVLLPKGFDPDCEEALKGLLDLRRQEAGDRYKRIEVDIDSTRQDGDKIRFLESHKTSAGAANTKMLPYYLLIVGSPAEIPYSLQFQLGVQRAVGRLCFETAQQYATYARNVAMAERGQVCSNRQLALFGPLHENDHTWRSIEHLIDPLAQDFQQRPEEGWQVQTFKAAQASKSSLRRLLGGGQTPALLLTAGHGLCWGPDSEYQKGYQGALVCQDWAGPGKEGPRDYYFSACDLNESADLSGLVSLHFACFSAGTPRYDSFCSLAPQKREKTAPQPFVAMLPQRMLSLQRGALAVLGHVDTAYWHSFQWKNVGQQTQTFESALRALMKGKRVGQALSYFGARYAELAADVFAESLDTESGRSGQVNPYLWTAIRDARSYIALGDPAVRIPLRPSSPRHGNVASAESGGQT